MLTLIRRMFVNGAKNFARAGSVSFATVLIMTVTLVIIGLLIFLSAVLSSTLASIRSQVDVNVYFVTTASETDIVAFEHKVAALPAVADVEYTSREDALAQFKERHASDTLTLAALNELGDNPLGASLAIKANNPGDYAGIAQYITANAPLDASGASIIDRVNYYQNKDIIDRLTSAIGATERAGLVIVILFAFASATIAFATVRLAIYTARDEIAVMRLMGAGNMYIRGPFIVAGIIAGLLAALIALALFFPAAWYAGNASSAWLGGFNLFTYYANNFFLFFGILAGAGVVLGGVASWLGVRRYLRI